MDTEKTLYQFRGTYSGDNGLDRWDVAEAESRFAFNSSPAACSLAAESRELREATTAVAFCDHQHRLAVVVLIVETSSGRSGVSPPSAEAYILPLPDDPRTFTAREAMSWTRAALTSLLEDSDARAASRMSGDVDPIVRNGHLAAIRIDARREGAAPVAIAGTFEAFESRGAPWYFRGKAGN